MKAALPIPYIIAILLGVLIFGVIGYWVFSQSGKAFGAGSKTECDAQRKSYCEFWRLTSYTIPPNMNFLPDCSKPKDKNECGILSGSCGNGKIDSGEYCDPGGGEGVGWECSYGVKWPCKSDCSAWGLGKCSSECGGDTACNGKSNGDKCNDGYICDGSCRCIKWP